MRKIVLFIVCCFAVSLNAQVLDSIENDTVYCTSDYLLDEVTVTSIYSNNKNFSNTLTTSQILKVNKGQEPSHIFKKMPSVYSMNDNGTEFGYGYFRIRGLDQTRINATLDGMPWSEAEDFGMYFANSPDLISSLHNISIERGTSSKTSGISASAGAVMLESVDLKTDTNSYADMSYGSSNSHKVSVVYNMGLIKNWGFHIKFTQLGTDGYKNHAQNQSHAVTAKLGYYFKDGSNINFLTMNGYHANGQGYIGNTLEELKYNPRANGNTIDETDNWFQSVNKLQYKKLLTSNTILFTSVYLQYQDGSYRFDLDNYMKRMVDPESEETNKLYNYGLTHYLYGGNVFVKDNTLSWMDLSVGVNAYGYQRRHFLDDRNPDNIRNMDEYDYYDNTGYKTDVNVLASVDFLPTDKFTCGFNIQYRYVDFSYKEGNNVYKSAYVNGSIVKTVWNFANGGLDFKYTFNNSHQIYLNLSVSNREPTRSTMLGGNEMVTSYVDGLPEYTTVSPELVHDVELGYNVNIDNLKTNVNLFFMKFKDELVLTGTYGFNGLPEHINANNSFRTGIEVSIDYEVFNGFHLINNSSWSKNLMKLNPGDAYNNHVLSPEWTVDQDVRYDYKNISVGANYNFRSSMFSDLTNDPNHKIPCAMTLNAYINALFFDNTLNIGLNVSNITNRVNYYNGCVGATGEMLFFRNAGTTFLFSARYNF